MIVATSSGFTREALCSKRFGLISSVARPLSTAWMKVMYPGSAGGAASIAMTYSRAGHRALSSRTFSSCSAFDTTIARARQSFKRGAICADGSVG